MSISHKLYPSQDDLLYEEDVLRNPYSLKLWWRYLIAQSDAPFKTRQIIYERAVKALPGSYKLWHAYLLERLELARNNHSDYETLNNTFERALVTMHNMPRIWLMYLQSLTEQKLITKTRRTFDRALCALPVEQHDRVWELYLSFVRQKGIPIETSLRVYRRYLQFDPTYVEDYINFLIESRLWQEAAERLASVLNDDEFCSAKGKTKQTLWLEYCDLLAKNATDVLGFDVDAIIRCGIKKVKDEVGRLWTSLAEYYIKRRLFEKARDVFEEAMQSVVTVRDFSVVFDSYAQFLESFIAIKMETMDDDEEEEEEEEGEDVRINVNLSEVEFKKTLIKDFWLCSDNDIDLRLAQLEDLMNRRPELVNSVALRQNPHNVEQWHRRVKLFEGNPAKQVLTYVEALKTVEPMLAVGKPHTLWVAFAKLYETQGDIANARVVFERAVQANYKDVDDLACVWCESAEMELKNKNTRRTRELMSVATAEPSAEVKRRAKAAGGNEPVQMKLFKSSRLWTLYVDLEESFGTLGSTREVYERMLDLRIATPQIIINYASLLEEHKNFEEAFKVYEKGTQMFKYPHVKDIWVTYLSKFVKRYGRTQMERARELFEHAIKAAPADAKKPLYLQFAKMEEDYGLAKRVMEVYHAAVEAVPEHDKLSMYEIYIACAAERFGVSKTREIYVQAIESGLPHKDVKTMCLKYAELEKSLGEIDRSRRVYMYGSQLSHPNYDVDFWNKWLEFEVQHGNEDTFRDMLRIKRTVSASYSQTNFTVMQKDQRLSIGGEIKVSAGYHEDIELPEEETDYENEKMVEIAQKDVPFSVFGHMAKKRKKPEDDSPQSPFGALERIQRRRLSVV